ncbi:uncharacterized protein LOC121419662 [Lytechinus variegatus]|uniref:uncharacterized protein LOC121419662 n=1 Tax=Lytechinus variegatus TaxID=7654 RepID=UPI001BB2A48F|nr:uncharacterized protein LOC121419662 [Lytechinus variegatus]
MLSCSTATMLSSNTKCFIFIVFMVMCSISESFRLQTEESLTAVRGRNISLPCNFSVPALAVYWYKHTFTMFTGAPDDGASLVARYYRGITDPVTGFERFSITKDYSLIIRNVTVQDETTYSCQVVGIDTMDVDTERGYTDLRVIALAEPLEPIIEIIEPCTFTAQGGCVYHVNRSTIGKDTSDDVILVSKLFNVRPLPNLTWIQSDGGLNKNATYQTQEKDGLFSISSQVQVPKSHLDHNYTCQAKGEAVNGTSLVVISFEDSATHVSNDRVTTMIISVIITIILLVVIMVIVVLSVGLSFYRRHGRWPWFTKEYKDTERSKTNGISMAVENYDNDDEPDQDTKSHESREADGMLTTVRSYRFAAFRIWSDYLHGYMGKGVRWPLPACVVTRVRQEFPNKTGVYDGFKFGKQGTVGKVI